MPDQTSLTLLFHNLFLVPPVRLGVGPAKKTLFDPGAHAARRDEYAAGLPDRYDIIATSEVFRHGDFNVLADAWKRRATAPTTAVVGPRPKGLAGRVMQSSGLATFVSRWPVTRIHSEGYRNVGRLIDGADRMATKGMLMVAVDVGNGREVEIASTHMHAGAWTGTVPAPHGSAERIRSEQVTELNQFLHTHHRKEATLLVTGDFNIDAYSAADDHLRAALGTLCLGDAWDLGGASSPGFTSDLARFGHRFPTDPDDPDFCIDSAAQTIGGSAPNTYEPNAASFAAAKAGDEVQRIDRWFVPTDGSVDIIKFARRAFPRSPDAPERDEIATLSDHVGLHLEVELT